MWVLIYLLSTRYIADNLLFFLEQAVDPSPVSTESYDAVVVLSGMLDASISTKDRLEFSSAVDRILAGIDSVQRGRADNLIISGGLGSITQKGIPEARLLSEFAHRWGVPQDKIWVDDTSRNTYESAVETARIVQENSFRKLLLITSAFHMVRSRGCLKNKDWI